MFLKIILPFCLLINISSDFFFPETPIAHKQKGTNDSLDGFRKNFMPRVTIEDEVVIHSAFVICYDERFEQARWVAYRLTEEMCNNNGEERSNNFRIDPDIKSGSATPDDYKKSGYDRGHLCPAGDMAWSEQSMSESFLMSNMSPQVPGFNRGIWKNLEANVREWARQNKEIYVVTAGVLKDTLATIGKNKVAIPGYYYKVILDMHAPEYKGIAFVLPNRANKESFFDYAVSIDSVEHLTGIDFFPALPDSMENYLEAHLNINQWK
jgi:endonuclease G, mitochondrial